MLASDYLLVAGTTGQAGVAFQSFRMRDFPLQGIILPVGKVPDLLDFLALSSK
jgi:hypothetical protein